MFNEITAFLIFFAYISCVLTYSFVFLRFDLMENSPFAWIGCFLWPFIFIGCLFALPFVAFVKLVKGKYNGPQKTL